MGVVYTHSDKKGLFNILFCGGIAFRNSANYNKNKLLWWYDGADGLKTGWIGADSGYNVAATAKRDDIRLVVIALGAEKTYGNFRDTMKLFDYGFSHYTYTELYKKGAEVAFCPIEKGQQLNIAAIAGESIGYLKNTEEEDLEYKISFKKLIAPLKQGEEIGEIIFFSGTEPKYTYPLYAAADVDKYGFFQALTRTVYYLLS